MMSDVVVCGILKERMKRGFRKLYIESHDAMRKTNYPGEIPILYWTRMEENRLTRIKQNTEILIRGHIESDEEIGLFVLVESIHFTK